MEKDSFLYLVKITIDEFEMLKIGVSNKPEERVGSISNEILFRNDAKTVGVTLLGTKRFRTKGMAMSSEEDIVSLIEPLPHPYLFMGRTECFDISNLDRLVKVIPSSTEKSGETCNRLVTNVKKETWKELRAFAHRNNTTMPKAIEKLLSIANQEKVNEPE